MGSRLSIEKIYQLPDEERISKKRLSKSDIKIVDYHGKKWETLKLMV